ncbi:alpha/beta hydrolase family protein [uncultured Jatrophihabitans sp.]|uniref:alpha/beta hydrolase family protein n=1 Tax=uncultured Jatrophihabitans sp. TaxID=1610747 RepID=UPI0035CC668B
MIRSTYGADPPQFGQLYRPSGAPLRGVVVIVHGGFWRAQYGLSLGEPLAQALVGAGYVCWNLEYRRVGNGGGWPATFDDVAAGVDHLATLDVDTSAVVAIGHSAGGQLATWAAGRTDARVPVTAVVSQAGVLDLRRAARDGVGGAAVPDLLGGGPDDVPERYDVADPLGRVPLAVPVLAVHARGDDIVPFAQSEAYVSAAQTAGGQAELREVPGDHFTLIDVTSAAWRVVVDALPRLGA